MNDLAFSILEAFHSLGGEADIAQVYARLESKGTKAAQGNDPLYRPQVRRQIAGLLQKEHLIRQKRGRYSLSFIGRQWFINELAWRFPQSAVLKQERKRRSLILPVEVRALDEGGYLATSDAIQGCLAEGNTVAEAIENLEDGAVLLLELQKRDGVPLLEGLEEFKHNQVLKAQLVVPLPE